MAKLNENSSRFNFLVDDVSDPFVTKKGGVGGSSNKTGGASAKKTVGNKNQQGQKKSNKDQANNNKNISKKQSTHQQQPKQANSNNGLNSENKEKTEGEIASSIEGQGIEASGSNSNNMVKSKKQKKNKTEQEIANQHKDWISRDQEFVNDTFEQDLEVALVQSKLEFAQQQQQSNSTAEKSKSKKKGKGTKTIPLSNFSSLNLVSDLDSRVNSTTNGNELDLTNEEYVARMRLEARQEIERQRNMEEAKIESQKRTDVYNETYKESFYKTVIKEKDLLIDDLCKENALLKNKLQDSEGELEATKIRFKKLCGVLSDAQMKDKAMLVAENEKLARLNQDLNKEIQDTISLLEKEKTKSHEFQKMNQQNRKRSNTESGQD